MPRRQGAPAAPGSQFVAKSDANKLGLMEGLRSGRRLLMRSRNWAPADKTRKAEADCLDWSFGCVGEAVKSAAERASRSARLGQAACAPTSAGAIEQGDGGENNEALEGLEEVMSYRAPRCRRAQAPPGANVARLD